MKRFFLSVPLSNNGTKKNNEIKLFLKIYNMIFFIRINVTEVKCILGLLKINLQISSV